jgi:hypothetical protein
MPCMLLAALGCSALAAWQLLPQPSVPWPIHTSLVHYAIMSICHHVNMPHVLFVCCAGWKLCDLANALLAFSWLSWLLWCAATALMGWTWHNGLNSTAHSSGAGTGSAVELSTTTNAALPTAAKAKVVKVATPAGGGKTGVPVSGALHTGKPGTGVDAV